MDIELEAAGDTVEFGADIPDEEDVLSEDEALSKHYDELAAAEEEGEDQPNDEETQEGQDQQTDQSEVETYDTAPQHWPEDVKSEFKSMTPNARKWLIERDKGMSREYGQNKQQYNEAVQQITPIVNTYRTWEPFAHQRGQSVHQMTEEVFNDIYQLESLPPEQSIEYLLQFADRHHVPLRQALQEAFAPKDENGNIDPAYQQNMQVFDAQNRKIQELEQSMQSRQQFDQNQRIQQSERMIQDFASQVDESGNAAHPRFEELAPIMFELGSLDKQRNGRVTKSLDDLYAQAALYVDTQKGQGVQPKASPTSDPQRTNPVRTVKKKKNTSLSGASRETKKRVTPKKRDDGYDEAMEAMSEFWDSRVNE